MIKDTSRNIKTGSLSERLVSAARLTFATNVILMLGGLVTSVTLARVLAPEGRGELGLALMWAYLFSSVAAGGQGDALTYYAAKNSKRIREYTNTALAISIAFGCLVYLLAIVVLPSLMVGRPVELVWLATLALLLIPLQSVSGVVYQSFRGAERYVAWNAARLVTGLGWLLAVGAAWFMNAISAMNLVLSFLTVIALMGAGVLLLSYSMFPGGSRPQVDLFRPLIKFGTPSMLTAVPQVLVAKLDQIILSFVSGEHVFGLYIVALAWGGLAGLVTNAAAAVVLPAMVAGGEGKMASIGAFSVRNVLFFSGLSAALLSAIAPWSIPLIFGPDYSKAVPLAAVLALAGAISSVNMVMGDCLRSFARPTIVLLIESLGAVVLVAVSLTFFARFGEIAVALSMVVASTVVCLTYAFALHRLSGVSAKELFVPLRGELKQIVVHAIGKSKKVWGNDS